MYCVIKFENFTKTSNRFKFTFTFLKIKENTCHKYWPSLPWTHDFPTVPHLIANYSTDHEM